MDATPNYAHWDQQDEFTVPTAAYLCCDLEPQPTTEDLYGGWYVVNDRMAPVAFCEMLDRFEQEALEINRARANDGEIIVSRSRVTRSALLEWAERTGRRPPFLFPEERGESPREWGFKHDTALLKIAREVIKEHWEGADPARAPAKDWMVDYLIRTYRISKGAAEAIDQVTRHDSRSRTKTK